MQFILNKQAVEKIPKEALLQSLFFYALPKRSHLEPQANSLGILDNCRCKIKWNPAYARNCIKCHKKNLTSTIPQS